jgi:hypothetical protein
VHRQRIQGQEAEQEKGAEFEQLDAATRREQIADQQEGRGGSAGSEAGGDAGQTFDDDEDDEGGECPQPEMRIFLV